MDPERVTDVEMATLQGIFSSTIEALEAAQREVGQREAERDAALARVQELERRVAELQELVVELAARAGIPAHTVLPSREPQRGPDPGAR